MTSAFSFLSQIGTHLTYVMATNHHLLLLLLFYITTTPSNGATPTVVYPIDCSQPSPNAVCDSYLYVVSGGLSPSEIATLYSADTSLIKTITGPYGRLDFLVRVPCGCRAAANGTTVYFHDTEYTVRTGDTPDDITVRVFSGLAWNVSGGGEVLVAGDAIPIHLPCGCASEGAGRVVVSYAVERGDTLSSIAQLLDSDVVEIEGMNEKLTGRPEFLDTGWVLFVPMRGVGTVPTPPPSTSSSPHSGAKNSMAIVLGISISIAFLVIGGLLLFFRWRNRSRQPKGEDSTKKKVKSKSQKTITDLETQDLPYNKTEDVQPFESERPVTFSLKDVKEATANFDEARIIGKGGFGSVYFGMLGNQEVAIKKMKSCKSREFFAELNVLCKVHHINVVELIGYASGDDHLYVVYEYVRNGSLNEHLHDPLLKGHQPLSWTSRTKIALDAARGIEYIHDHTKACYVHRDIKTSNILLDDGLRAKVADFGLAKLVERSNEEEFLATRLVGTPGYLPPESVRELQMTTKTDVFAFGVVLAELITGYRALIHDNKKPNKMRPLISIMNEIFQEEDPGSALEAIIDGNLKDSYPVEEVHKMAEISVWCLNEDAVNRPEMREITMKLSQILMSSIEWEASLGGSSQIFSGVFNGR